MWSDGQAANEHGEPVLLFQPTGGSRQNNKNKSRPKSNSSTSHHLGGLPCYHERDTLLSSIIEENSGSTNPRCKICNKHMYLLIQLHAPLDELDRTLYVFGCNTFACHSQGDTDNEGLGDDVERSNSFQSCKTRGSVCCLRSQQCWTALPDQLKSRDSEKPKNLLGDNDWGVDDGNDGWGDDDDDGWGGGNNAVYGENVSIDDLEKMLNNCEMKSAAKSKSPPQSSAVPLARQSPQTATSDDKTNCIEPSFEHHDLETLYEPMIDRAGGDEDADEDDVEYGNVDASKVDEMLSRYLDMEDDEEILLALKGEKKSNSGGGVDFTGSGGERYERLPPEERALLAFSTRLKRSPGQVARYAYGGVPFWSMPLSQPQSNVPKSKQKSKQVYSPLPVVPNCACGAERVFEFQILPSALHVLDVDSHATGGRSEKRDDLLDLISAGGMNWGVIAVYSCPESCDESREEFIIVQDAVSDVPIRKNEEMDDASDNDTEDNTEDMT